MSIHGMACLDIKAHHGMLAGMARTGRPKAELTLTEEERATLERWARRATSAQALAQRCRIVLACAEGKDNKEVAAELGVHQVTVGKWRSRFIELKLVSHLRNSSWPGRALRISRPVMTGVLDTRYHCSPSWAPRGLERTSLVRIGRASGRERREVGR